MDRLLIVVDAVFCMAACALQVAMLAKTWRKRTPHRYVRILGILAFISCALLSGSNPDLGLVIALSFILSELLYEYLIH
jgi:hypothetical protein